jgi:hypothetical protein
MTCFLCIRCDKNALSGSLTIITFFYFNRGDEKNLIKDLIGFLGFTELTYNFSFNYKSQSNLLVYAKKDFYSTGIKA